jgi:ribosomal protein S18 acetylase RimI-like enzyme
MGWSLVRARVTDAPGLIACIDAAYAQYRRQGLALPDLTSGIASAIATGPVWLVQQNQQIIAGLILSLTPPEAYLENLAVHPDHAGTGLARHLLETAYDHACVEGCKVIKLTTHKDLPQNIALYEHLGWHVTRSIGDKVAMERPLGQN